jgi:predicted transcriptional regulator of viral defense system
MIPAPKLYQVTKTRKDNDIHSDRSAKTALSKLARHAMGGVISVDDSSSLLGLSPKQASARLTALARQGWLIRVRRGLYYIRPLESGAQEPPVAPDSWVLATRLFSPCYIGGWSAAEHWGLTEQLFRSTFVVTAANVRHRSPHALGAEFHLVRVLPERLVGTTTVWRDSVRVAISDPERTLADALIDPRWIGGMRHLVDVLDAYVPDHQGGLRKIFDHLEQIGRRSAIKRLGFLLEKLFPEETALIEAAHARRSTGLIRLDPSTKGKGRLSKRWGLWINVTIPVAADE